MSLVHDRKTCLLVVLTRTRSSASGDIMPLKNWWKALPHPTVGLVSDGLVVMLAAQVPTAWADTTLLDKSRPPSVSPTANFRYTARIICRSSPVFYAYAPRAELSCRRRCPSAMPWLQRS